MSHTIKPLEELDVIDDFLINATAGDREVGDPFCRTLVSALLQRTLGKIQVSIQRVISANTTHQRGIRMDVEITEYSDNESGINIENIYDLEPNRRKNVHLPKHNRFYQAKIDSRYMKSGEKNFIKLPNLFVITITDYDPFGYDYMMYTISNRCHEIPELNYDDGLIYFYFNTSGTKGGNDAIKTLLNYLANSTIENVKDDITKQLHECTSKVKLQPEVRKAYMTWEEMIFYERQDAKDEGKIEGKIESIIELLSEFGPLPNDLLTRLNNETNNDTLNKWIKIASKANSLESFIKNISV